MATLRVIALFSIEGFLLSKIVSEFLHIASHGTGTALLHAGLYAAFAVGIFLFVLRLGKGRNKSV